MIRALALACLLPGVAAAQDFDTMDRGQCESLLKRVDMLQLGGLIDGEVLEPEAGWCRYEGVRLKGPDTFMDYAMDRVRLRIGGAERLEHGLPPEAVDLEIRGAYFLYHMDGKPVIGWQTTEMMRADGGIDLAARVHWERDSSRLVISELMADFPWDNELRLSGVIEGVDLSDRTTLAQLPMQAGLARLEGEMVTHGLFETFALGMLAVALLTPDGDPQAQVDDLKARGLALVGEVPGALLPGESKAALGALIADIPHPAGRISVRLEAEAPLNMARFLPLSVGETTPERVWALLDGVRVEVDYAREGGE